MSGPLLRPEPLVRSPRWLDACGWTGRSFPLLCAFATIGVGLVARALIDKLLATTGGGESVARWAQLQSVSELLVGVVGVGLAQGLTVMVAQRTAGDERRALFGFAGRDAMAVAFAVAALVLGAVFGFGLAGAQPVLLVLAVVAGACGIANTLLTAFWLGRQQQGRVLLLSVGATSPVVLVALAVAGGRFGNEWKLGALVCVQILVGLVVSLAVWWLRRPATYDEARDLDHRELRSALRRFIPVGLAIGLLSPLAQLSVRADVATALQWHDAGLVQAIWRTSESVGATLAGVLSLVFLPRLSAAFATPGFVPEIRRAALFTLPLAALALSAIYLWQRDVFAFLYASHFVVSDRTLALFFVGDIVRISSWVILFALLAAHATWWVALGEFLSLPLFALLVHLSGTDLTLEHAGRLWLLAYVAYLVFNLVGLRFVLKARALRAS